MILKICDWIIFYSLIFLVTLTPLVINPWGDDQFRLPKEVFAQIMIIIAFSSWLIKLLEESLIPPLLKGGKGGIFLSVIKRIVRETPFMLPISLLILASLLSIINSTGALFSFKSNLNIILYSLLYILIVNNIKDERHIRILLISALISGAVTSIYCLVQYFGFDPITHTVNPAQPNVGSYRTTGFLDNPDIVSGYLIIFPTVALSMFFTSTKLALRILFFSVFLLITSIIIMVLHSIAPIFGLLIAFVSFTIFARFHFTSKLKIGLTVILISFIGAGFITGKFGSILNRVSSLYEGFQDLSSDRLLMWRTAGEMIKDKPIVGIGIGMYKVKFFEYRDKVLDKIPYFGAYEKAEQAHNEYLQLWAEMGTIGITAVIWLIISYFVYAIKLIIPRSSAAGLLYIPSPLEGEGRVRGTTNNQLMIIGLTSGVIAILIDAIGSFPFHIAPSAVVFVVLISLTVSLNEELKKSSLITHNS